MGEPTTVTFASLLRNLRGESGMTQEELARAARVGARSVSDLERGVALTARHETARRLADALNLAGTARDSFLAAARGRALTRSTGAVATGTRSRDADDGSPQSWLSLVVTALDQRGIAAARSVVQQWHASTPVEDTWLGWVEGLIRLTAEGRVRPAARRPLPAAGGSAFLGRNEPVKTLSGFLERVRAGRGGVALVLGPAGMGKSRLVAEALSKLNVSTRVEWVTFDRGEAGYRGWRRLLAPIWSTLRRTEMAPADLLAHAGILDDLLLATGDGDLAGKPFPGEVAAAVAAMLGHLAVRQPVVLVLDDAHRGGASSDELLLDVARRVSAHAVGLIAGLRADDLEDESPLGDYRDQADGRAALDVVVPVRLPPLGLEAASGLLLERTGAHPPAELVQQVIRQTAGRPQLILNTRIQLSRGDPGGPVWTAGPLEPEGLRVLQSTIQDRPSDARTVLQAAAISAAGGVIDPGAVAAILELPDGQVEDVLDQERRRGTILAPLVADYTFQHDNWIDALIDSCPSTRRRDMHARCLGRLRSDPAADPQCLARHAIGAGATLIGASQLVALTRGAADVAFADYAFGAAAELYEVAARYATGPERIALLIGQADAWRFRGRWKEARELLRQAATLARAADLSGLEAQALTHLGRLIWSFGLDEKEFTQQLRDLIIRLPPAEKPLRAQAQAALAFRLAVAPREYHDEQAALARAAWRRLPSVTDSLARADIVLGVRSGLQDEVHPRRLLEFDAQLLDLGVRTRSAHHIHEALVCRVIDLVRAGQLHDLPAAMRAHRQFAQRNPAPFVMYSQALLDAMIALATGDFAAAQRHTAEVARLSEPWGQPMANEAVLAQTGWLLYETGRLDGLAGIVAGLRGPDVTAANEPLWALGVGLINAEEGEAGPASQVLRAVSSETSEFEGLPRGQSRIAILATAAAVLGHPSLSGRPGRRDWAIRLSRKLAGLLAEHHDAMVMAGWPAVMLGSKQRYIGLAHLAACDPARAAHHLAQAARDNDGFAALQVRTRFDRARALLLQPGKQREAIRELHSVRQIAAGLGMARLAAQAAQQEASA